MYHETTMQEKILQALKSSKDVLIVGASNTGKSFFVQNTLRPFLQKKGESVHYFKDGNAIPQKPSRCSIVLLDEFEILDDREFLEAKNSNESPYYSEKYLNQVKKWNKKIDKFVMPRVYILTRNDPTEIQNILLYKKLSFSPKREIFPVLWETRERHVI